MRPSTEIPKRFALIAALSLAVLAALAPGAQAAQAPAWMLTLIPEPSNFAPGQTSEYVAVATNVGAAPTSGRIDMEVTLPPGLEAVEAVADNRYINAVEQPTCTVASTVVSCETSEALPPGRMLKVQVTVDVSPGAPEETLSAQASVLGGGAEQGSAEAPTTIAANPLPFEIRPGFAAPLTEEDGAAATTAGSHPQQYTVSFGFPSEIAGAIGLTGAGHPRYISTDLPPGLLGDPAANPVLCTEVQLISNAGCPEESQVGLFDLTTLVAAKNNVEVKTSPVYDMVPPPGSPAELAFDAAGVGFYIHLFATLRTDGNYGIEVSGKDLLALGGNPFFNLQFQTWGDPSAQSHDATRGACLFVVGKGACPVPRRETAFLTMPSQCSGAPLVHGLSAASWEEPGLFKEARYESADLAGNPVAVSGCNQLEYEPQIEVRPTTNLTESPSGLDVNLHQPQNLDLGARATAATRDVSVTLPEGMTLNPSAADGLESCSSAQIGLQTPIGQSAAHFDKTLPSCPDASKLGTLEVSSPVLVRRNAEHRLELDPGTGEPISKPLQGSVYLAKPFDNPFDSLIAIYLAVEDEEDTGIVAKLPGQVSTDPLTGQLVTTFSENPQLPIEDIHLELFKGARASLITPPDCATHTTTTDLTPWSAPEGQDATPTDSFQSTASPSGGACPATPQQAPNAPAFSAGTIGRQAGAFSPFVLKLSREDGSQRLAGFDTLLPGGLSGKLAGIPACSDAALAQAASRSKANEGILERNDPSCPEASKLGTVTIGAGAGPTPYYTQGNAYLAGPYKGAPLSMAVITPAIAGPFDLGTVLVRAALYVEPETAQIHAVSDPFPQILHGIPLDLRSVAVSLDRPSFTLNPTSCDPLAITGSATSVFAQSAALNEPFQVGDCQTLPFKPKLSLQLKGKTKRTSHPTLIANLTAKPGEANIARAQVKLPKAAFLDQSHLGDLCTRPNFAAHTCPANSIYGKVSATTPLLEYPLSGDVVLRPGNHELPDLVADLRGPDTQPIEITLAGKTDAVKGALRNTFETVPDQPVTKFHLELFGGKRGLIELSSGLCKSPKATIKLDGQNGKVYDTEPAVRTSCKKGGGGKGHKHHHHRGSRRGA